MSLPHQMSGVWCILFVAWSLVIPVLFTVLFIAVSEVDQEALYYSFLPFHPVAYPMLNYALELGLRFSQFNTSSQYLIKVAQEMIRKRRLSQDDGPFVKVCLFDTVCTYVYFLHYINH